MTDYYKARYDNEASGPFVAEGANLTWPGGVGFIVTVVDDGTTGKLAFALVSGTAPADNVVLTQGITTADVNEPIEGAATIMLYPAYFRPDVVVPSSGLVDWTGPALGATHSFFFDGQTVNVVAGEVLTFSPGGQTCEVVTVEADAGASGELSVRWISFLDLLGLPADNDTFSGDIAGDGALDGVVHDRTYTALHIHRLLSDLGDDPTSSGDDDLSSIDPTASAKDTDQITRLLGTIRITDTVANHMYGGSVSQSGGDTLYSGANLKVTSPLTSTQPVLIQNGVIVTDYWKNGYNPDSIAGNVRILRKTREDGVDFDGKRILGKLLEFGEAYFEAGTTLDTASTQLALVSDNDGNNNTPEATVAGAPYNTVVLTEGFQSLDFNNGNGATPYALSMEFGSAVSLQAWERGKWIQRRGTAETLFGQNAQLITGVTANWAYDTELLGPYTENEILAWGTEVDYTGQTVNFDLNEVVLFSGGGRGRIVQIEDNGATGNLIVDLEPGIIPLDSETLTGVTSGGNGTAGTVKIGASTGTAILLALDDQGTTGNLYVQLLTGFVPSDGRLVRGGTSFATSMVNGSVSTRVINRQLIGLYTGTNFQTNFGVAVDPTDAIVGDALLNLLGVSQLPPNNQSGVLASLVAGDVAIANAWDGVATDVNGDPEPDFNEMTLATALVAGVSATVDVGTGNIPINTPQVGNVRVERDSDSNFDLLPYSSHDGDALFTLVGLAPSAAAIGRNTFRAFFDLQTAGTQESYTAVFGGTPNEVALTVLRGSNSPIKDFKGSASFGATGFFVNAQRITDV